MLHKEVDKLAQLLLSIPSSICEKLPRGLNILVEHRCSCRHVQRVVSHCQGGMPRVLRCSPVLHREVDELAQLLLSIPISSADARPEVSSSNFELEWALAAPAEQPGAVSDIALDIKSMVPFLGGHYLFCNVVIGGADSRVCFRVSQQLPLREAHWHAGCVQALLEAEGAGALSVLANMGSDPAVPQTAFAAMSRPDADPESAEKAWLSFLHAYR